MTLITGVHWDLQDWKYISHWLENNLEEVLKCCLCCQRWLLPHWQWLYLLSGPALHLRVGELVFLMRKALSNLPPIFSGNVSADVSGSFFTLPMTQRPFSAAVLISTFKNACHVWQEKTNKITATLTWKLLGKSTFRFWQIFGDHTVCLWASKKVHSAVYF